MKNKRTLFIAVIVGMMIVTIGTTLLMKLTKMHQANQLIIEECFENFGEENVVVTKGNLWSEVSCKND